MKLARLVAVAVAAVAAAVACQGPPSDVGTPGGDSPYGDIEPERTIVGAGLSAPVDVIRDAYGIPHIWARTVEDAAFANGYVMARDRFYQMNLFRHFASGTTAELFGGLAPAQIDSDIQLRIHRFRPLAQAAYDALAASADPFDQEMVRSAQRFSDGVNLFIAELKERPTILDGSVTTFLNPDTIEPWTPVDSLAIGRLQTYFLSYDDIDLRLTAAFEKARAMFPAVGRTDAQFDLFPVRPMDTVSTMEGWPNVSQDSGSRAKPRPARAGARRRRLDWELLARARRTLDVAVLGLKPGQAGSNNWIVGPSLGGGATLLANDPHLPLSNPPIWYFLHITVPGVLDIQGGSFAGVPGVVLGHNEHIAWGATVVRHDVTDFYEETIVPCAAGGGDCVVWNGGEVPIQTWTETVKIGTLGIISEERQVTYELVPHHGPIIPTVQDGQVVPRTGSTAISVRYTGYEVDPERGPSQEIRAFTGVTRADSVEEAREALQHIEHGAQNFVIIDDQGHFGWTTPALVPWRSPGCFSFSTANPDGVAPFLVIPGDGSCEWESWMDHRYLPHAFDPDQGFVATANADPVGETFDGDPLNGPMVDGRPLYVGALYDSGFRVGRITRRLEELKASGRPITADDMASIQGDVHSNYGERLRPHIAAAAARLAEEIATPGAHPDLTAWAAALPSDRRTKVMDAAARLADWSLDTPAAVGEGATAQQIADSAATTLFVTFTVYFLADAFGDELELIGERPDNQVTTRTSLLVFERPEELRTGLSPVTGEPLLCDDLRTTPDVESCTLVVVRALDKAVAWAEAELGPAPEDWRWGKKHTVTFTALTPQEDLNLPLQGGYPRPGDNHVVDVAHPEVDDFNYTYDAGASMRHISVIEPGGPPRSRNALPGGQIFDPDSPHYGDLGETYWVENQYFDMPWTPEEIVDEHETRWVFTPN